MLRSSLQGPVCLDLIMRLPSVGIVLLITTTGLVGIVNSVCVVRNAIWPVFFWYQCSRSTADYQLDVDRAPLGLERISFTNSDIPVLKNASFSRLGQSLKVLVVSNSKVREIEDRAFQGLDNLVLLDLSGNRLTSLKGVWFENIQKVQDVYLKYNQISHIEDSFYTTLPKFDVLGLANNRLKCLSLSSTSTFNVQGIDLAGNPLTWKCISQILDWGSSKGVMQVNLAGLEATHNVTKSCIEKSPTPDPEDNFLNTCVENSLNELLPAEENYTVEELCQFLADKPSFYLDCAK